jgi:hypothetical protein
MICIFLCMMLRNEQPLKSRGLFPIISAFFGFWSLSGNLTYFVPDFEWRTKYECYFTMVGFNPTISSQMIILFLYSLKIVLVLQVNNHKVYIRNQNGKQNFIIRLIYFLKLMTSDVSMVVLSIVIFAITFVGEVFFLFLGNWKCANKSTNYFQMVHLIVMFSLIILLFVVDFILTIKNFVTCQWRKMFIASDPFLFRIQQWFGATLCILALISIVIYVPILLFIVISFEYSVVYNDWMTAAYFVLIGLTSIFFYTTIFYFIVIVLLMTIFNVLRRKLFQTKIGDKEDLKGLQEILNDEELLVEFKKFADSEWSSENYLLYYDIIAFKKLKETQLSESASRIIGTYLNGPSSELQVNLPNNLATKVSKSVEQGPISSDLFDGIMKGVEENLKDTFSRFRLTKFYKNHFESKKFLQDQI